MDNSFALLAFGLFGLLLGNIIARLSRTLPAAILERQSLFRCFLLLAQSPFSLRISLLDRLFHRRNLRKRQRAPTDAAFIELGCAFLFMCLASGSDHASPLAITLVLTSALMLMSLIDARHCLLPDALTLPLLAGGLIAAYAGVSPLSLNEATAGALFGYALLWIPERLFFYLRRAYGLGQGDIKLMAAVGAWLGAEMTPIVLLVASLLGVLFFILRYAMTGTVKRHIPFGPFITFSMWLALLKDPFIINLSIGIQAWL